VQSFVKRGSLHSGGRSRRPTRGGKEGQRGEKNLHEVEKYLAGNEAVALFAGRGYLRNGAAYGLRRGGVEKNLLKRRYTEEAFMLAREKKKMR